jgi:hypothetical protein
MAARVIEVAAAKAVRSFFIETPDCFAEVVSMPFSMPLEESRQRLCCSRQLLKKKIVLAPQIIDAGLARLNDGPSSLLSSTAIRHGRLAAQSARQDPRRGPRVAPSLAG